MRDVVCVSLDFDISCQRPRLCQPFRPSPVVTLPDGQKHLPGQTFRCGFLVRTEGDKVGNRLLDRIAEILRTVPVPADRLVTQDRGVAVGFVAPLPHCLASAPVRLRQRAGRAFSLAAPQRLGLGKQLRPALTISEMNRLAQITDHHRRRHVARSAKRQKLDDRLIGAGFTGPFLFPFDHIVIERGTELRRHPAAPTPRPLIW